MSELPFQIERYIVKKLACNASPETIADDVQAKFLREVTPDDVREYCPDPPAPALGPALRDLYQLTEWEYEGVLD